MNSNTPPTGEQTAWGLTFAEALKEDFPLVAEAVTAGLGHDPTTLLQVLRDQNDAATAFQAVCHAAEAFITHIVNTSNVEKEELHSQIQTLGAEIREKTATVHSLAVTMAQLSTNDQTPQTSSGTARRISKDPEAFSGGEKDVAKRQQQFVVWRSQINSCFAQDTAVFNTERRKILHIAGLLTGDAYEFHRTYFDTITESPTTTEPWYWKTAEEVFRTLSSQFETMDLAQQASQKFDNLFMLNKPFQNFIAEFRTLAQRCNKTEPQKVEALKKKVSKELADKLAYQPAPPAKDNFDGWCGLCQQLYNNEQEFKHFEQLKSPRQPNYQLQQQRQIAPAPNVPQDGDPIQLDAARAATKAALRAFCGENNLCFYCKKPGHMVADCNDKKIADERYGYRTPGTRNRDSNYRGRGSSYSPRGRGGYRFQRLLSPFAPQPQTPPQYPAPFNQLRILEQSSPDEDPVNTPFIPSADTPGTNQALGKE
jgi:hypothetical protein